MKAQWQGYIALGQLGIPVRLYPATRATMPEFRLVHAHDGSPVERVLKCRLEDKEIAYDEVSRAVEIEAGKLLPITKQELERAGPRPPKVIGITQFAKPEQIAPVHYEKPYYMTPGKGGERAYALLRDVLLETDRVAIAQFMMRDKEHIGALAPYQGMVLLHRLRFSAGLVPKSSIKTRALPKPSPTERAALRAVVERFTSNLYMDDYHDEHAEAIAELLERKSKGLAPPKRERTEAHATAEDDIIPTLQNSLTEPAGITAS